MQPIASKDGGHLVIDMSGQPGATPTFLLLHHKSLSNYLNDALRTSETQIFMRLRAVPGMKDQSRPHSYL